MNNEQSSNIERVPALPASLALAKLEEASKAMDVASAETPLSDKFQIAVTMFASVSHLVQDVEILRAEIRRIRQRMEAKS